jgi:hypothetical protein
MHFFLHIDQSSTTRTRYASDFGYEMVMQLSDSQISMIITARGSITTHLHRCLLSVMRKVIRPSTNGRKQRYLNPAYICIALMVLRRSILRVYKRSNVHPQMSFVCPWTGQSDGAYRGDESAYRRIDQTLRKRIVSSAENIVVSLSNGELALLRPNSENSFAVFERWLAHSHEPWIAAWNYWDMNVLYSGP